MIINKHGNLEMEFPSGEAKVSVIADSINEDGDRILTFSIKMARFVLSELNTHRVLSRNSGSSRAVPVAKQLQKMRDGDFFIPQRVGYNQKGMQSKEFLNENDLKKFKEDWVNAAMKAVDLAEEWSSNTYVTGSELGIHKQHANRILEPYIWHEVVITGTLWDGFIEQRDHQDAQPEIEAVGHCINKLVEQSQPELIKWGEWHLPFIKEQDREEISTEDLPKVSAARSARVSYLTHMGEREISEDLRLYGHLVNHYPPHASPLEHPALALSGYTPGNYERGWAQLRGYLEPLSTSRLDKFSLLNKSWLDSYSMYNDLYKKG